MEIIDNTEVTKKCFKSKDRLLDNLNIVYNESNSTFIFWNKYQIFIYEDQNFDSASKVVVPEFLVSHIIVSNNYLVCLDTSGNVQITSLKFKNAAQKRFKSSFQPRENGILTNIQYSKDSILSLKYESFKYFLCLNRITAEFVLDKKVSLKFHKDEWAPQSFEGKCILLSCALSKEEYEPMRVLFNMKNTGWNEHSLVIVTTDKYTIYGCLFSQKTTDEEIELVKLYATPSEICDINILEMHILIGVKTGTVIKLPLQENKTPDAVHLNTGIYKFIAFKSNDTIIYTDGSTMWKAEKTFSKSDIIFSKFFIKQVKDFAKFGDCIICTTYSNLFYTFSLDDEKCYLRSEFEDEYCPAEKFIKNSDCYVKILEEVDKNNNLLKKINEEECYLTALSLSHRQDIMDTIINLDAVVYENYEDVIRENTDVTLTEELHEYFKESFFFFIKVTASILQQNYSNILSNLLGNIKIHITLSSDEKLLKTTSLKLMEPLKKIQFLVPLQIKNMINASQIKVDINIVTNIPGVHDVKHTIWAVLYRKSITFNSENFIKINTTTNKNLCLKEPEETIENLIQKTASRHHGHLFHLTDINKHKINSNSYSMYVKLPNNFKEIFKNNEYYGDHFHSTKASFLQKQILSEEFLKSNSNLTFEICKAKVVIEIINDFSSPLLKVSCDNIKITFNIRNFFAKIVYNDFGNCQPAQEYVNYAFYTTTENMQKAVKKSIVGGSGEMSSLADLFHKTVIGALPL